MKRHLLFLVFISFITIFPLEAQDLIKNSSLTGVCYAGKKINKIYIPPPEEFFKKGSSKLGGSITVCYTGFSTPGETAVEFAVSILEKLLPSDAKLTITASWENISTSGVLAQSTITGFAGGAFINALNPISFYPVALAEKIAGKSLNEDSQGDIHLLVNSEINWYLGIDGNTPVQRYDLVTVALHEICHGLGFFDSMDADATIGWYGFGSVPMIYDTFIENINENNLTDTLKFTNFSSDLRSQLTGGQLYFNGPLLKNYSSGSRAKLFAPSTWDDGSSISHLDEAATLQSNSLMTPFIDLGEAIHDPGKYTFSIFGDLGWINTRINHAPMGDSEDHLTQILLSATIKSDTAYNHNKVGVVFSFNNFLTSDTSYLISPGSDDSYNITINVPSYNSELKYYLFAEDAFSRLYRSPSLFRQFPYKVFIGTDTIKPAISHIPVDYYLQMVDSIKFDAIVTDNIGIDSVYVEYKVNNGPSKFIRMQKDIADNYSNTFDAGSLLLKGRDSIEYRIFAVDSALTPNLGVLPKSGFFVTHIEEISSTLSEYSTDFTGAAADFFNIGFEITRPAGFSKDGINTKHPYESPEDNDKSFEYTSLLRHPIKFGESGLLISFNEIVLVEPGEPGSVFGSSAFYDYVIVEGSKNFGKTWFSLIDGYDSRSIPSWETAYNSSIVGNNSTYTATEDMLFKRIFLYRPSGDISIGDSLLLRFRLYSDPFANGWGWVIEDLKIGPLTNAIPDLNIHPVNIYPNPGSGLIKIKTDISGQGNIKPLHFSVFNSTGLLLIDAKRSVSSDVMIDISNYPAGIYIIVLYLDDGIKTIKYSLIK